MTEYDRISDHWLETSRDDLKTMKDLFKTKSFHWALFIGHIAIEKSLKALYVKIHRKHAPAIHNLYRLAELCDLELTDEQSEWLDTITTFNINARYDDYKKEFYNLCTPEYTATWISHIEELHNWITHKL